MHDQNSSGFALITAKTTGSDPNGSNVAEIKLTINTVDKPIFEIANTPINQVIVDSSIYSYHLSLFTSHIIIEVTNFIYT
jgi:hypothetical protein